eukprot:895017-Amorphochlora_amoeboformis.AAC.2
MTGQMRRCSRQVRGQKGGTGSRGFEGECGPHGGRLNGHMRGDAGEKEEERGEKPGGPGEAGGRPGSYRGLGVARFEVSGLGTAATADFF